MKLQKIQILLALLSCFPMFLFAQNDVSWKNGSLQFQWIEKPLKLKETSNTLVINTKYYEIQCEKLEKEHTVAEASCDFVHEMEKLITRKAKSNANCQSLTYKNCSVLFLELDEPESHTIIAMSNDPSDRSKHLIWHISTPHKEEPLLKVVDTLFKTLTN